MKGPCVLFEQYLPKLICELKQVMIIGESAKRKPAFKGLGQRDKMVVLATLLRKDGAYRTYREKKELGGSDQKCFDYHQNNELDIEKTTTRYPMIMILS